MGKKDEYAADSDGLGSSEFDNLTCFARGFSHISRKRGMFSATEHMH